MKKIAIVFLGASMMFAGCEPKENSTTTTSNTTTGEKTETVDPPKPVVSDATCYAQVNANDTVKMRLNISGSAVTGTLEYRLKEKDSNRGTISGTMNGETLLADYTFNSEGTSSVRQVAFLIKDGKATEGYGDMEEKNGKMVFKDPAKVAYGKGIVLSKVDCE